MDIKKVLSQMTLEEKAGMCSGLDFWHLKGVERLGVPSVMVCDGPHGLRKQDETGDHMGINTSIKATCFPTASALASSYDRELLYNVGETLGKECQAEDIAVLLGPGANIKRSPLCGRNFEYFSEDPFLSAEMSAAHINGLQSQNVGSSLKHYAANNQESMRMTGNSVVDERTLHEIYLASFEGAIKNAQPKTVMCAYNQINGTFAAENKELLTDILRDKWGFSGLVVTDWGAVKDRIKGLEAGLDLEMPGNGGINDIKIAEAVRDGTLDEAVLDRTVLRILALIDSYMTGRKSGVEYDRKRDFEYSTKVAAECAVLLKNDNNLLPLSKDSGIAFIGEFASKPRYQGSGSSFINSTYITSAMDSVKGISNITYAAGYQINSDMTNASLLQEAVNAAKNADVAVIFAGLPNSYESEGFDRKHMDMPPNQNELIAEICKVQSNVVVVLHNGAPVTMPWVEQVPAILEMYLGGDGVGAATVSLLFGDVNPSGKLAETFPVKLADNPSFLNFPGARGRVEYHERVYVGYRYYDKKQMDVLFPFGHGLSYTKFSYSNLTLDRVEMTDEETLSVTFSVKNTGKVAGKEIAQIYVVDKESTIDRPVRELKGFTKVALQPGEEKLVTIALDKRAFAYYEPRLNDWHVESGSFIIEVGASSRDIRLRADIEVKSNVKIPFTFTPYTTFGEIMSTTKGKSILEPIFAQSGRKFEASDTDLGEGSKEMMTAMMNELPIAAMASFGMMSSEQLQMLISALNS